jgi:hypothetical protein
MYMKLVQSLQGGEALAIVPPEYLLMGSALADGLASRMPAGTFCYEASDSAYAEMGLDELNAILEGKLTEDEIRTATRGLAEVLTGATEIVADIKLYNEQNRLNIATLPDASERKMAALVNEALAPTELEERYRGSAAAFALAQLEELTLRPKIAAIGMEGLRLIASTHGVLGGARNVIETLRPDKPYNRFTLPRRPQKTRLEARRALREINLR